MSQIRFNVSKNIRTFNRQVAQLFWTSYVAVKVLRYPVLLCCILSELQKGDALMYSLAIDKSAGTSETPL